MSALFTRAAIDHFPSVELTSIATERFDRLRTSKCGVPRSVAPPGRLNHDRIGTLLGQQHRGIGRSEVGVEFEEVNSGKCFRHFNRIFVHSAA